MINILIELNKLIPVHISINDIELIMNELSIIKHGYYMEYIIAYNLLTLNPHEGIDRPIKRVYRDLMSKDLINKIYMRNITYEEKEIMEKYTLNELKKLVIQNYYPISNIIYKPFKKNWAKALLKTKKWSFNVFAIKSNLNDDVLKLIKSFI